MPFLQLIKKNDINRFIENIFFNYKSFLDLLMKKICPINNDIYIYLLIKVVFFLLCI